MQYLLMIYEDENVMKTMGDADRGKLIADYGTFTEELRASGAMVGGDALEGVHTATSVRVRNGTTRSPPTDRRRRPKSSSAATT